MDKPLKPCCFIGRHPVKCNGSARYNCFKCTRPICKAHRNVIMVMVGKVVHGKQLVSVCKDCIKTMVRGAKVEGRMKLGELQGKVASELDKIGAKPNLTIQKLDKTT